MFLINLSIAILVILAIIWIVVIFKEAAANRTKKNTKSYTQSKREVILMSIAIVAFCIFMIYENRTELDAAMTNCLREINHFFTIPY